MKPVVILTLILSTVVNSFGQVESDIIGKWKAQKAELSEEIPLGESEKKETVKMMVEKLGRSSFEFTADKKMTFTSEIQYLNINSGYWIYVKRKK